MAYPVYQNNQYDPYGNDPKPVQNSAMPIVVVANHGGNYGPQGNNYMGAQNEPNYGFKDSERKFEENPYPTTVDNRIHGEVRGEEARQKNKKRCLDCIPKLRGDDDQQNFVRKVFGILTVQILFTVLI